MNKLNKEYLTSTQLTNIALLANGHSNIAPLLQMIDGEVIEYVYKESKTYLNIASYTYAVINRLSCEGVYEMDKADTGEFNSAKALLDICASNEFDSLLKAVKATIISKISLL